MLPVFSNSMYVKQGHTHQHDTRQKDELRNSATRLIMTEKYVRHYIPQLLCETPNCIINKFPQPARFFTLREEISTYKIRQWMYNTRLLRL